MMQVKYQDILIEILAFILENVFLGSQDIIYMKLAHIGAHYWLVFFFSQIIEIYSKKFNPPCKSTRPEIYPEFKMHLSTLTRGLNAQKYGMYYKLRINPKDIEHFWAM